jgi:uncharacterized membrane protein (DUF485 family)
VVPDLQARACNSGLVPSQTLLEYRCLAPAKGPKVDPTYRQLLDSHDFKQLVSHRWWISLALTACLFVVYYGYILLIAGERAFLSRRIGGTATTFGIPIGAAVIFAAWLLTAIYIVWANRVYDPEVARLRGRLKTR